MKSKITMIVDRYEGTFIIIHRNNSDLGKIYYKPTKASMGRYATVISTMFKDKKIKCYQTGHLPIYSFVIL